jgi:hypothetical protein
MSRIWRIQDKRLEVGRHPGEVPAAVAQHEHAPPASTGDPEKERQERRLETFAAIVLGIAALATAWTAYQATRWGGEMSTEFNEASSLRAESVRLTTAAGQQSAVDVTIAADWLMAAVTGNEALANELRGRMSPELADAMNDWLDGWRFGDPLPPGEAFETGQYRPELADEAEDLQRQAESKFTDGQHANQNSDNYVLTGVLLALTLFFAGIATRFESPKHAQALVLAGGALVAVAILLLLVQPKSLGV